MPKPKRPDTRRRNPGKPVRTSGRAAAPETVHLYGLHAVRAAIGNSRRIIRRLLVSANALPRLDEKAIAARGLTAEIVEPRVLDRMVASDAVHQGVIAECEPLTGIDASEVFQLADARLVLVLDQVTDPHNVGAIMRTACAFACEALIVPHRGSARETGALAKSASGALDLLPMMETRNLSRTIGELGELGFVTVGLDSDGPDVMEATLKQAQPERIALVLGSEGKGLRQQTREACAHLARLDMPGAIRSLNVSNAAALALYVASTSLVRSEISRDTR